MRDEDGVLVMQHRGRRAATCNQPGRTPYTRLRTSL
jgi:hypothetical protein